MFSFLSRSSRFAPPCFWLGVALIWWGYLADRMLVGVFLAMVFEGARWVKLRWDFEDHAFLRSWQLSALLIGGTMVMILVDGGRYVAVPRLMSWLPLLLLPVQFTQSYGVRDRMPVTTFSFFARRRMLKNLQLGLPTQAAELNFGWIYGGVILMAATLGDLASQGNTANDSIFSAGVILLGGWAAIAVVGKRPWMTVCIVVCCGLFALLGQFGLRVLYARITSGQMGDGEEPMMSHYQTAIGSRGELKLSPAIQWRMKVLQGPRPALLRTTTFNHYDRSAWVYRVPPEKFGSNTDFDDLKTLNSAEGKSYYLIRQDAGAESFRAEMPRILLRGAVRPNSALPVPSGITAVSDFELDGIESNPVGTVRIFPRESVTEGIMVWEPDQTADLPPWTDSWAGKPYQPDLRVPSDELPSVREVVDKLGLRPLPLAEKLNRLKAWFAGNFRYTRYLSIDGNRIGRRRGNSAIGVFLSRERAGHCEYFATATCLILREAGVPTRYAIGFAVMEQDRARGEWIMRGQHGHAWCRVWDESNHRWIDFDTTPGSWLESEIQGQPWYQGMADWLQRSREDFFLWRNRPENTRLIGWIMAALGVGGSWIVGWRLWKSRRRQPLVEMRSSWAGPIERTPLNDLEMEARPHLGGRPPGMPLGLWLQGLRGRLKGVEDLDEAIQLHARLRFDPESGSDALRQRLAELVTRLREGLKGAVDFERAPQA